jgi:hypothetical protein
LGLASAGFAAGAAATVAARLAVAIATSAGAINECIKIPEARPELELNIHDRSAKVL